MYPMENCPIDDEHMDFKKIDFGSDFETENRPGTPAELKEHLRNYYRLSRRSDYQFVFYKC